MQILLQYLSDAITSQTRHEEAIRAMQQGDGDAARDAIRADISEAM